MTPADIAASNTEKEIETGTHARVPGPLPPTEVDRVGLHSPASFMLSFNNAVNEWWLGELLGWLLSFLALATLIAVLAIHDQKPSSRWQLGITLNAIISVCAIIAQTTMLIPVAQGISQLKWHWFHRRHALSTMQLFDDASRGPWGALRLLLSTRALLVQYYSTKSKSQLTEPNADRSARHLSSLGALIAILALTIEPFIQQVVSYPFRRVRIGDASVNCVHSYNITGQKTGWGPPTYDIDLPMKAAINQAIFSESSQMAVGCSTGNCTWPRFLSLAICSHCQKIQVHNTTIPEQATVLSTSNGLAIYLIPDTYAVLSSGQLPVSDLGYIDNTIANLTVLGSSEPSAYECTLFWCVQEIKASVSDGIYDEEVLTTWSDASLQNLGCDPNSHPYCEPTDLLGSDKFSLIGYPNNSTPSAPNFSLGIATQVTFGTYLSNLFTGNVTSTETAQDLGFSSDFMGALVPSRSSGAEDSGTNLTNVPELIRNLSQSMTTRMRQSAVSDPAAQIIGDAYALEVFVQVRWGWLTLPLVLLLLTLYFLLASIRESKKANVMSWKSSSIALLFHGLAEDRREVGRWVERRAELHEIAGGMEVQLVKTERGWRLM